MSKSPVMPFLKVLGIIQSDRPKEEINCLGHEITWKQLLYGKERDNRKDTPLPGGPPLPFLLLIIENQVTENQAVRCFLPRPAV